MCSFVWNGPREQRVDLYVLKDAIDTIKYRKRRLKKKEEKKKKIERRKISKEIAPG